MKEKKFIQILTEISLDIKKVKRDLLDKRLTLVEKLIIEGYINIRGNKNLEVINSLESTFSSSLFVESQRLLLMATAYNHLSQFELAKESLLKSINLMKDHETNYFHFLSLHTLFTVYANLNDIAKLEDTLKKMKAFKNQSEQQELKLLRCCFCYYQMVNEIDEATKYCNRICKLQSKLSECDTISFLVDKFIFHIQTENFAKAYETLVEVKLYRNFQLTENYNYMKTLLDHLVKDTPIYSYEAQHKNSTLLYNQIKVIQNLEECNTDGALEYWKKLQIQIPSLFADNFQYTGSKCLFSLCLKKQALKTNQKLSIEISNNSNLLEGVLEILNQAQGPVAAGMIYEILFKEAPTQKSHINKVAVLIHRLKKKRNVEISYHKGTYCLKALSSQNAS